ADPEVLRRVLAGERPSTGATEVLGGGWYAAYEPLRGWRGDAVGILGVGGREAAYADLRRQTVTLFAGLIALGMIFGFIMTYTFSGLLIRPVADLAEGMHRVAHGDLGYKVRIESADELGKLATAFNRMVRAIRQRDIRLREMTEERLSQVEKQVSIGRLAAGVAHEINNPLTSILSLSMLALRDLEEDDPRREDLQIVVEETDRCREIVRALLDFARERPPESRRVDLNQVIRDTLVLTSKYEGMEKLRVILKLTDEPLLVHGDPKQLQQVFTNLITNAVGAVGAGGDVTISSDEDSSGGYAVVRVMDTGKGIRKEDLDRVFEPFFTTKAGGRGTGLGLSVSLGIVRKHDGTIDIESEEGYGTTVSVYLPRETEGGEGRSGWRS
ncbi:MAG: HAMP domain-containing protein, partial [Candidatus Krumholzibacteriota bacterium]|nr:HAMP domain-containing protein [Candidatus Krumholzibacteriota bacterium]